MELTIIETSAYQDLKKQLSMLSSANDGLSKENSPRNTGQVTGCAGCVPGSQYFQKGTADLPG
ncbi:MAG: hypothetical protein ACLSIB_00125 [Parabacteroides merdae]